MRRIKVTPYQTLDYFESPSEFARLAGPMRIRISDDDWRGGSWSDSIRYCTQGDVSRVAQAERMIESLTVQIESPVTHWQAAPAGAFPIVPDYLAGRPDCMRRKVQDASSAAPIRVFLETGVSAGINVDRVVDRGIAFLALAMSLSRVRPVELFACNFWRKDSKEDKRIAGVVIPINAAPLDIALACGVLTQPSVTRGLMYSYLAEEHRSNHRGFGVWDHETARKMLRCAPSDIYVPPLRLGDALLADPVAFINAALGRIEGA